MVSPMREKRTWPPQDKDSDGETVAAFEAAVAVVKETVVRSGEVLVSAKEDLHDHQRWLKAQTAKVQADRDRHDRFLHRQRERQEALLRREQKRERRRAKRQAAARSIKDAVSAAIYAVRSAVSSAIYAVRSAVWLVVAKTIAGLNSIDAAAAYGLRWLWGVGSLCRALCGRSNSAWRELCRRSGPLTRPPALVAAVGGRCGDRRQGRRLPRPRSAISFRSASAASPPEPGMCRARSAEGLARACPAVSAKADVLTRQAGEALGPAMASIAPRTGAWRLRRALAHRTDRPSAGRPPGTMPGAARCGSNRCWRSGPRGPRPWRRIGPCGRERKRGILAAGGREI